MRTIAPRSCIHEHRLQLRTHRRPHSRRHGRLNAFTQYTEQPENQLPRKDDQDLCDFPYRRPSSLLHHTSRHVRQQTRLSLRLDRRHEQFWVDSKRVVFHVRLPRGLLGDDRL